MSPAAARTRLTAVPAGGSCPHPAHRRRATARLWSSRRPWRVWHARVSPVAWQSIRIMVVVG